MAKKTPAAKTAPSEPVVWGEIPKDSLLVLSSLRAKNQELLAEIGRIELRKIALASDIQKVEAAAQKVLKEEATKLGIPEGQSWSLTPDGKAISK